MDTLLVHGYVREIESALDNERIIPLDIYHICFDFYFTTKIIFYLSALRDIESAASSEIDLLCAADFDNKQKWKISIQELNKEKSLITLKDAEKGDKWALDGAGISFTRNINLPTVIENQISNSHIKFNNVVFRCGGASNDNITGRTAYCAALIFNSHEFHKSNNGPITAHNWKLPELPYTTNGNFVLYSDIRKELWSIGGWNGPDPYTDSICTLSFDDKAYFEQDLLNWKWNKLNIKLPTARSSVCATMIDKARKLIVVGGETAAEHADMGGDVVNIFDIDEEKCIPDIKNRKCDAIDSGIYYDDINELIYVGGGFQSILGNVSKMVECYDIEKNVWNELVKTNKGHDMNPLIWIEDNNLLFIASISANYVESIDLRENKKWIVQQNDLSNVFDTKFKTDMEDATACRLVGN